MSIEEPKTIGAVARAEDGYLYVRAERNDFRKWWDISNHAWLEWHEILPFNPVIVHEGYATPTPEPTGVLAVIRDAEGVLRWRRDRAGYFSWERADGCGSLLWGLMPQPVEVLFEGVDE